jgi:predicted DNA-binding WGR domain protein
MARYEFVEGKSSKFWEATLDGSNLIIRFGRIGTDGQIQTKQFTTREAAQKEHDKLVTEKTKKGYQLAGQQTPSAPLPTVAESASDPALRKDLYVYNEATGFLITSKRLAAKGWDSAGEEWEKAVCNGDLIPTELYQDDSFVIRVVVGGELSAQESDEWCGRLDWKLRVPDGNLVVCAGSDYVMEDWEDEEGYIGDHVRHLKIPRGDYKASLYMYLPGVNGAPCLRAAQGGDEPDPFGEWFRRTRPNETFPEWLHNECIADPSEDPGHEKEWKKAKKIEDPHEHYVAFLIHLTPSKTGDRVAMPELNDGWFSTPNQCRVPKKIPLRIPSQEPEGRPEKPNPDQVFPVGIFEHTEAFKRSAVKGGTVEVPVERLERLFRVAWFCHPWTLPEIRVHLPKARTFSEGSERIDKVLMRRNGDVIDIQFEATGGQSGSIRQVADVASRLNGLPDDSIVEIDTAWVSTEHLKKEKPIALQRYRGIVRNGKFAIEEAFPCSDAATLNGALALAAQIEAESVIDAGDEQTASAVLAYLKKHAFFSSNPAVASGSTGIAMKDPEPAMLNFVAADVFKRRFKQEFPLMDLERDDEDEQKDNEIEKRLAAVGAKLPPKGEPLLTGANGRVFHSSDAMQVSEAVRARITAVEKDIAPLGFRFVADVVCSALETVVVRAYAQNAGTVWAALLLGPHGNGTVEFITKFEKGATLTVTTNMMSRDELFRHAFKSPRPGMAVSELWKESERRVAWFSKIHGTPLKLTLTAKGLAEDVEESIRRQEAKVPAKTCELLFTDVEEGRSYYSFDGKTLDAAASQFIDAADRVMKDLGYTPVGDVVGSYLSSSVQRGYVKKGGDTWAKFVFEACSSSTCSGHWEFVTTYEKGVLVTTRAALSKDEPKRKIYRILDPNSPPRELLVKHEKRKAQLVAKCGTTVPVKADLHSLAAECEASIRRLIG